jgi:cephalosporin-C deacetylase
MPLLFDMPLDQLLTYEGRNPKPADFERYWDTAIDEMRQVDPQVELIPAKYQNSYAECFEMFFRGVGGARVHAKLLRPKNAPAPHPALLYFHGYSGNAGEWHDKLPYVAAGYTVAALDARGQGGQSSDPGGTTGNTFRGQIIRGLDDAPEKLLFRQIFLDTAQLAGIVMEMDDIDEARVGATGGSQGGALTIACAALEPRIKLAAPSYPFLSDYRRVWEIDLAKDAYWELQYFFRWHDPLHEREEEVFEKLGYIDIQHLAPRIRARVMMQVGLLDTVCPPSTQFAAYNKIASPKEYVLYPDYGHEYLPGMNDRVFEFMKGL